MSRHAALLCSIDNAGEGVHLSGIQEAILHGRPVYLKHLKPDTDLWVVPVDDDDVHDVDLRSGGSGSGPLLFAERPIIVDYTARMVYVMINPLVWTDISL